MKHTIKLNKNQEIDLLNIVTKAYAPVAGYMSQADTDSVLEKMRLTNGHVWSIPVILDVKDEYIASLKLGELFLESEKGEIVAKITNPVFYPFKKDKYCKSVFGTDDTEHPGVKRVQEMGDILVSGKVTLLTKVKKITEALGLGKDYLTPKEMKAQFKRKGWKTVVAFQTRNPPHRLHEYLQKCALEQVDGLLIQPVSGEKKSGDFKDDVIIGSYKILTTRYYNEERTFLSVLPMYMKYAGPKEAIFHAIIRQNFGCTHMIIGRDHAGVGSYYAPLAAQEIFDTLKKNDLKIRILKYESAYFCKKCNNVASTKTCPHDDKYKINISGTKLRGMFLDDEKIPGEFMRPEISKFIKNTPNPFV